MSNGYGLDLTALQIRRFPAAGNLGAIDETE